MTNPADVTYLDYKSILDADHERDIVTARKYHEGEHIVPLTERMRKVLGIGLNATPDMIFRMNVTRSIVTAVSERLIVSGFDATRPATISWANDVWVANRMQYLQDDVHEGALRDSEYFVIVDWDKENKRPRFSPHQRYTSVQVGGDGYGCFIVYPGNDPNQPPKFAVKVWQEEEDTIRGLVLREFRTVYYPDRIEKYREGDSGELELLDTESLVVDGVPLGIPVIHFLNKGSRLESWDGWPLQNAINKTFVDLLASADLTAFRIYVSFGFIPTVDGKAPAEDRSNWLTIEPGQLIGTSAKPNEAGFEAIEPADLKPLIDLTEQTILWMAMVTDTPVNRFISTRQIASDKTLKEQEGPLLAKVRNRQMRFGTAWLDCLKFARKLHNAYSIEEKLDPNEAMTVKWAQAQPSAELDHMEVLQAKGLIGVPDEQLWIEAGYTQEKITEMKKMNAEAQARLMENNRAMAAAAQTNTNTDEGNEDDRDGTE